MRDGWTLTVEHLTYDRTEPDEYDTDTELCIVVRQYGTITHTRSTFVPAIAAMRVIFMKDLAGEGIVVDPDYDWRDYVLLAETLHARALCPQPETLPLAV